MQVKLIVVLWVWRNGTAVPFGTLSPWKQDYLLRLFNTSGNFSLEQVGPGAQARRKHVPINLKSQKSLFEPIECGLSVLNHLIRRVRHRNKDRSHDCTMHHAQIVVFLPNIFKAEGLRFIVRFKPKKWFLLPTIRPRPKTSQSPKTKWNVRTQNPSTFNLFGSHNPK